MHCFVLVCGKELAWVNSKMITSGKSTSKKREDNSMKSQSAKFTCLTSGCKLRLFNGQSKNLVPLNLSFILQFLRYENNFALEKGLNIFCEYFECQAVIFSLHFLFYFNWPQSGNNSWLFRPWLFSHPTASKKLNVTKEKSQEPWLMHV